MFHSCTHCLVVLVHNIFLVWFWNYTFPKKIFCFLPFHNCVSASIIFSTKECSSPGVTFIDSKQNIFINPSVKINQNVNRCIYSTLNLNLSTYLLRNIKETSFAHTWMTQNCIQPRQYFLCKNLMSNHCSVHDKDLQWFSPCRDVFFCEW